MLDGIFLTEVLTWVIGAMVVCTSVLTVGALMAMGRSGYRKE